MYRRPVWFRKPSPLLRYTAAVLLAVAAQVVRLPLDPPTLMPNLTYVPFMVISAWLGGFGPGLLTTSLCVLESLYFAIEPIGSIVVREPPRSEGLSVLAITGLVASVLFERIERARQVRVISEEVRVQLAREWQSTLETIIQNSPAAAIALLSGSDFKFVTVNPAYQALAPGEPMIGRTVADVWPEAAPLVLPLLWVVRNAQTVYHAAELAIPRQPGSTSAVEERYFNIAFVPVPGLSGDGGVAVLNIALDVTEQKKAQQELRAAYTELAAIYASAPVVLLVVDDEFRVEKLNDLGLRITGQEISEVLGLRPGGALGCVDALADPNGCGRGPSCTQCPLRLAVFDSVRNGNRHDGVEAWVPSASGQSGQRCFLVSTAPLPVDHERKVLVCAQDITELKRTEQDLRNTVGKLESALAEKTILLQEVHHRVKNNLAVICSLLSLKADVTDDNPAKLVLEDSQRRVHAMALIHEHLYGSEHLDRINFAEYTHQLVQVLRSAFAVEGARIAIRMEADPIELGVQLAMPAALILSELLSNALKHAFPGSRGGEIHITFRESEPEHLELAVEDNGVGSPDGLVEGKPKTLGLQIVRILTAQLAGTLDQETSTGTRMVVRFPVGAAGIAGRGKAPR